MYNVAIVWRSCESFTPQISSYVELSLARKKMESKERKGREKRSESETGVGEQEEGKEGGRERKRERERERENLLLLCLYLTRRCYIKEDSVLLEDLDTIGAVSHYLRTL